MKHTPIPDRECILSILKNDFNALWSAKQTGETIEVVTPFPMPDSTFLTLFFTVREGRYIASDGGRVWELIQEHTSLPKSKALGELRAIASVSGIKEGSAEGEPIFFKECAEPRLISSISFDVASFAMAASVSLVSEPEGSVNTHETLSKSHAELLAKVTRLEAAREHIGKVYACRCGEEWTQYGHHRHAPDCKAEVLAEFDCIANAQPVVTMLREGWV